MKKIFLFFCGMLICNLLFSQWAANGSSIYNTNVGNVGIGFSNPIYPLDVNGGLRTSDGIISRVQGASGISGHFLGASNGSGNLVVQGGAGVGYNAWWLTGDVSLFKIGGTGGSEPGLGALNIDWLGRVGVGRIPEFALDVNSTGRFGATSGNNANLIVQGGAGLYDAFWITGINGSLKIGGSGATEPLLGAINIDNLGNVGIGTSSAASYRLVVEGKIGARELKVTLQNPWPDYVFHKNYDLLSINDLETFIKKNQHLPNIPSAQEIKEKDGVEIGNMTLKLLEKVEELTLYIIQLKKEINQLKQTYE